MKLAQKNNFELKPIKMLSEPTPGAVSATFGLQQTKKKNRTTSDAHRRSESGRELSREPRRPDYRPNFGSNDRRCYHNRLPH